jgi:hypothetical protein
MSAFFAICGSVTFFAAIDYMITWGFLYRMRPGTNRNGFHLLVVPDAGLAELTAITSVNVLQECL